jgi:hypothetical protein
MLFFTQIFLILTWFSEDPLSTPLKDIVQVFILKEFLIPQKDLLKKKLAWSQSGFKVKIIELTVNNDV